MSYRFCFYLLKTLPWLLGLGWLCHLIFLDRPGGASTWVVTTVLPLLLGVCGVTGLIFGVLIVRHRLKLRCPFCTRSGVASWDRSEGLTMRCPACREISGGGALGWTPMREKDRTAAARRRIVPVQKMQFQSPWFWLLFLISVASAVYGVVIHAVSFITFFGPLWCFLVASPLIQALQSGCLNDNTGPTFRARQPVKFWLGMCLWFCGYVFAVYLPVGFARQDRHKADSHPPAAVRQ